MTSFGIFFLHFFIFFFNDTATTEIYTLSLHDALPIYLGDAALVFGRIDRLAESPEAVESFHIGRLAVADEQSDPVVVDWRAPVAEPFYRATGREPMGLVRRRHFVVEGRQVLGLEDELFGG